MAKDEAPSHIDQVFAEGKLVDEGLAVAAADAVERHRQAGEPLVLFRDGRIAQVPAEELDDDQRDQAGPPASPLPTEGELTAARTAKELISWFDDRLRAINRCPNAKRAALLHQGLFKKFYEEVYPFALFVQHVYAGREDVLCSLGCTRDNDYDAMIQDSSTSPPSTTYVQLTTTTFTRNEFRRMKHFLEHGRVSVFGEVNASGDVALEFVAHEELLGRAFEAIAAAVQRKVPFSHGADYVLVVTFDDFMWFGTADDLAKLTRFINERLASWPLNVATLYVLGISGRTCLSFPVPHD